MKFDQELVKKCKVVGSAFAEWININGYTVQTSAENWHNGEEVVWARENLRIQLTTSQLWALFMEQVETN